MIIIVEIAEQLLKTEAVLVMILQNVKRLFCVNVRQLDNDFLPFPSLFGAVLDNKCFLSIFFFYKDI